jgi:hypothetical protein
MPATMMAVPNRAPAGARVEANADLSTNTSLHVWYF